MDPKDTTNIVLPLLAVTNPTPSRLQIAFFAKRHEYKRFCQRLVLSSRLFNMTKSNPLPVITIDEKPPNVVLGHGRMLFRAR